MIEEWYIGFYDRHFRDLDGRLSYRGLFGHCEVWGYTADGTWLFLDPQGKGTRVRVEHRHDEVNRLLAYRFTYCSEILRIAADDPEFRAPVFWPVSCASFCGHLLGIRALLPHTLKRRLLAKGAEVVHEKAEGRSGGQASEAAGTSPERDRPEGCI